MLGCPCEHPCVIKFMVIHSDNVEVYTLRWNGARFEKCWIITQMFAHLDNQVLFWQGRPDMEG
jgi:hypothetical protein